MKRTLQFFSLTSLVLGVFWGVYAVANGFRAVGGDPSYFFPQAFMFIVLNVAGWAVFGSLAKILGGLDSLERPALENPATGD